jgi:acyl dehydratase
MNAGGPEGRGPYASRMTRFTGIADLLARDELGISGWHTVDQSRIDRFAEVTGDRQWIHVDPRRAAGEGPFGGTIAHGALTLSLCVTFLTEILRVDGVTFVVNGGFDKVRFQAPVRAGARLRGVVRLLESRPLGSGARIVVRTRAEIEGEKRPACVADQVLALYTGPGPSA